MNDNNDERSSQPLNDPIKQSNVLDLWANKISEVNLWISKLQVKDKNALHLYQFCKWAKMTPTELLEMKKDPTQSDNNEAEKLLDAFVATEPVDLRMTKPAKKWTVTAVRSFFRHNYCDLARASGAMDLEKEKPYNKLSKEGLRKLWNYAYNPRDKALLTFACSTAIAKETLSEIKWKHLEDNWEKIELPCITLSSELLKGHGRGKYKGVQQITFLTPEAKRDLITYKGWIETKMGRNVTSEDHIFLQVRMPFKPASYDILGWEIWQLSKNAAIPFSLHDARRWVNTALEQIGISSNWARKIRGRKVRGEEAPYSQPAIEQLREKFREAVPLLEFTSETSTVTKETLRAEVMNALEEQKVKEIAAKYHVPIEQVRTAMRSRTNDWERALKKGRKTETDDGNCTNGQHCQKIVSEDDLSELLADGWTFVATLPSGKCVVSNET
jgi:hypothetical protein